MKAIKYILSLVLLTAVFTVANAALSVPNVSGNYSCKGYDPYTNSNYTGTFKVKKVGNTYTTVWDLGKDEIYTGAGVVEIHQGGSSFSVLFYKDSNVRNAGLAAYDVQGNKLKGQWIMSEAANKVGFEDCVKQS